MKIGLNEYPWESMRSPEEIKEDADREKHNEGYCEGAPYCWWCQEAKEEAELWERTREANKIAKSKLAFMETWEDLEGFIRGLPKGKC